MMNPEIKARWVAWLRANADKQGKGKLQENGRFCCLGGLCEIAVEDGVITARDLEDTAVVAYGKPGGEWEDNVLPPAVWQWAGLNQDNPDVTLGSRQGAGQFPVQTCLTELNDGEGWDFNQIADIIDEQL